MLNLTNAQILDQIKRQGSMNGAAKALGISWQTVQLAKSGKRKGPEVGIEAFPADVKLCGCCKAAPVGEGLRKLCQDCYEFGDAGVIAPECPVYLVDGRDFG